MEGEGSDEGDAGSGQDEDKRQDTERWVAGPAGGTKRTGRYDEEGSPAKKQKM